ncbi:MAG: YceI family protein [Verrucomicrobiota bacterium]
MLPDPDTCQFVKADDLDSFEGLIFDVRTPEAYAEAHIPGTVNHCVYQVDFLEKVPEAYPDKSTPILVYGDGDPYKADLAALGRLQYLGYSNVSILEGGLGSWLAESRDIEGEGASSSKTNSEQILSLNSEKTKVRWVGRNLMNQHNGEIAASSGFLEVDASGSPVAGEVIVDLRKMTTEDITDPTLASSLIGHLASADFFDVENHPEASFKLLSVQPIEGATYGKPNFSVSGTLEARGRTLNLEIEALVEPIEEGYVFQSNFNFDRTELGALYGSGKFFERLGMHLVNDLVSMSITAFFVSK